MSILNWAKHVYIWITEIAQSTQEELDRKDVQKFLIKQENMSVSKTAFIQNTKNKGWL